MKTITVKVPRQISIPETAREWELFHMRGCGLAAARLTRAVIYALDQPTREKAEEFLGKAFAKESEYGATDSEPSYHLEKVLDAAYGSEWDDDEGYDW